jgi:hypothetical protein
MEKGIEGKQNVDVIFRNIILTSNDTRIAKQETSMSEPAPVRHPGQPPSGSSICSTLRCRKGLVW